MSAARILTISRAGQPNQTLQVAIDAVITVTEGDKTVYKSEIADMLQHVGKTRAGNAYDRITGARVTPIDVAAGDLAYRFPDDDAIANAAFKYTGTVEVIDEETKEHKRIKVNYDQIEPIDFYLRHKTGELERSDKDGNLDPSLETREPNNTGVVAMGEVTGQGTPKPDPILTQQTTTATPGSTVRVQFEGAGYPRATRGGQAMSKTYTRNLQGGQDAEYAFRVPADAKNGIGRIAFGNATKSASNPVRIRAHRNEEAGWGLSAADAGGAPNFVYEVVDELPPDSAMDSPMPVLRETDVLVTLTTTGTGPADMIANHQSPG